jgi:predicted nucleotidyltransferase component of viral defense system
MAKIDFYKLKQFEKEAIFNEIATLEGMKPFAVEKDWWVSLALEIIFQMDISKHLVFKGGTSLSKAWKLINRFSEDIDLAIDMDFFMTPSKNWSKSERTELRKKAGLYSTEVFFQELQNEFIKRGYDELQFKIIETNESDKDPRILEVYYPNIIAKESEYILTRIQIEVSCRSLREPFETKMIGSLVDEVYADRDFAKPIFGIPSVIPERTFLEKLFLLHEEFHRPSEKMRVDRLSRHLYDLYYLAQANIAENAINDKDLYETIVQHRFIFSKIGGVNYNSHNPKTINPIPPENVLKDWESDYLKMKEDMIYEQNPPTFKQLINYLEEIRERLKSVSWEFDLSFPNV